MEPIDYLILYHDNLKSRIDSLFDKLVRKNSNELRVYLNNPVGLLASEVFPELMGKIPKQNISEANKFFFSVISNKNFLQWINDYQKNLLLKFKNDVTFKIESRGVLKDFADAFVKFGDKEMLMSIININNIRTPVEVALIGPTNQFPPEGGGGEDPVVPLNLVIVVIVVFFLDLIPLPLPGESAFTNTGDPFNFSYVNITSEQFRILSDQILAQANRLRANNNLI